MTKKKARGRGRRAGGQERSDRVCVSRLSASRRPRLSLVLVILSREPSARRRRTQPLRHQNVARGPSGLPLPRFVSLKSGRVNSRIGPGVNYAVDWMYLKPGLPMEIIQEYDNWRRVRDSDGSEGWINQSLLSGRRTGIAAPWQTGKDAQIQLLDEPERERAADRHPRAGRRSARSSPATATGAR